jgi:hypothetical protein
MIRRYESKMAGYALPVRVRNGALSIQMAKQ